MISSNFCFSTNRGTKISPIKPINQFRRKKEKKNLFIQKNIIHTKFNRLSRRGQEDGAMLPSKFLPFNPIIQQIYEIKQRLKINS